MCFVTSKILLESKDKGFCLDLPCNSSSFIFNLECIFSFSNSMRYCCFNFYFLFPFLFVFPSLVLSFLTSFPLVLIFLFPFLFLSQHPILAFLCFQSYSILPLFFLPSQSLFRLCIFTLVCVNALVVATTSWWLHFSPQVVA